MSRSHCKNQINMKDKVSIFSPILLDLDKFSFANENYVDEPQDKDT